MKKKVSPKARLTKAYAKYQKTAMHTAHPGFPTAHKSVACK